MNNHDIKNHIPPAKFRRTDPHPEIPFYEEEKPLLPAWLLWAAIGLLLWGIILYPVVAAR